LILALAESCCTLLHARHSSIRIAWNKIADHNCLSRRYQFNPHLARDETITNILVKALTVFPSADFSLCLSLLPTYTIVPTQNGVAPASGSLAEAVHHLSVLHEQLTSASYADFWNTFEGDDLYADLVADVQGFEEVMKIRIAVVVSQCMQEVQRDVLEGWLNVKGDKFDHFVSEVCGWKIDGATVHVPLNKENEARSTTVRENVKFDQFGRLVKRAYEQPA
jgi:translation initiation factor 3 subunit K